MQDMSPFLASDPDAPTVQFVMFEARPHPDFDHDEELGGAFVNCYLRDRTPQQALAEARAWVERAGWYVVGTEEQHEIDETSFDEDESGREHYEQALADGEVFVFYTWPADAIE